MTKLSAASACLFSNGAAEANKRFEEARSQASQYAQGVLLGNELSAYRYAVVVGGVIYRHINIAVEPRIPSRTLASKRKIAPASRMRAASPEPKVRCCPHNPRWVAMKTASTARSRVDAWLKSGNRRCPAICHGAHERPLRSVPLV